MARPNGEQSRPLLSVVIPVYNEQATIRELIERVESVPIDKELVVVDDYSTDGTGDVLRSLKKDTRRTLLYHEQNMGKGAALRTGFQHAKGQVVIVQDADLEYDPFEYESVVKPILEGRADVVYGSRFSGGSSHRVLYFWHTLGNRFLTLLSNMMTDLNLTDMETCYKAFRNDVLQTIAIAENRFGFEPEITSKVSRGDWRIYEVGISYAGRTYAEGKKIGWRDGVRAVFCIVAYSPIGVRFGVRRASPFVARLTGS